jgi:hypothetical protein
MFQSKRVLAMILIFSLLAVLSWPVSAQETKPLVKSHCPYCGVVNSVTNKFCAACGSKLPIPTLPAPALGEIKKPPFKFGKAVGGILGWIVGSSVGVYLAGNTENQTGSYPAALGGSVLGVFVPFLSSPFGATVAFNLTRRYKTPPLHSGTGMINLSNDKLNLTALGFCGAKLSDPMLSFSVNGKELAVSSLGMRTPCNSLVNDCTATKIFDDGKELPSERRQGSVAWPIVGGILAGGAGFLVGGFSGAACTTTRHADFSSIGGFIVGAPIGEMIGLPIGVHLGNGRRGNFPLVFLASVGIAGTGIWLTSALGDYRTPAFSLPLTALTQLIACVAIERTTGNSR